MSEKDARYVRSSPAIFFQSNTIQRTSASGTASGPQTSQASSVAGMDECGLSAVDNYVVFTAL